MDVSYSEQSADNQPSSSNGSRKKDFRIEPPPADWNLNQLLIQIAKEMSMEDLQIAKMMFKGQEGLGRRVLSETLSAMDLFDSLQTRRFIDRDNLLYLQGMLYRINRTDLFDKVVEYATHTLKDTVYFKTPAEQPENGYVHMRFHIQGKDLEKTYTNASLQNLRATAATIMGVPPQFIMIDGVEPFSSLLITLMVPEAFVRYFKAAVSRNETLKLFDQLHVDKVVIGETIWKFSELETDNVLHDKQEDQLAVMYRKLQNVENKLDETEGECLQLKRQLKLQKSENEATTNTLMAVLIRKLYQAYWNRNVPRLTKMSAISYYRFCLKQINKKCLENELRELMLNLLDAHGLVVQTRMYESQELVALHLIEQAKNMENMANHLELMKARKQFSDTATEVEKATAAALKNRLVIRQPQIGIVQRAITFGESDLRILKEISDLLSTEEKQQLYDEYVWPKDDWLTVQMQQKQSIFLACLFCKAMETTDSNDLAEFVTEKLKKVKREDLVDMFDARRKEEATQTTPAVLKNIQDQLGLLLERMDTFKNYFAKGASHTPTSISVGPLQMGILNFQV